MKKISILLIIALVLAALPTAAAGATPIKNPPGGLKPGEFVTFSQHIPINLVFVGYGGGMIDSGGVLSELPHTYDPLVRYPPFYGVPGRPLGLHFDFSYKTIVAPKKFEDRFFKYLRIIGKPGDPTDFQLAYNEMETNVLDVAGPVLYIEGPAVEKYLVQSLPSLGVTGRKSYTIFFINWYSRPDFKFHVYTKTDAVDPDTGYNFGENRASRKMIAWGGSHGRAWFYDLSAGPEAWTENYAVDYPDLDGDGVEDYRMPPIWEYTAGGYRDPSALSKDLGLVARFVGINLLFTASPLYDPLVTAPKPSGDKIVHIEMFEDDPASLGTDWIDTGFAQAQLKKFQPYYRWAVNLEDNNPIDAAAQRAFRIWAEVLFEDDCWSAFGTPFAELFCFFQERYADYVPAYGDDDYVAPFFAFNTTADNMGPQYGLLGYADDNWIDGTQSYVFAFDTEDYRSGGYGFSTTTVHEGGHHIGLSHPHDGYDSELGIDYGPSNELYFAWSGDESNTIMHYMDVSLGFGLFDRDNMYRYEFAGYMNWANELLDDVIQHPDSAKVKTLIKKAKLRGDQAQKAFESWNYQRAASDAWAAYAVVYQAAQILGIDTGPTMNALRAAPGRIPTHEGDPIRFPDN